MDLRSYRIWDFGKSKEKEAAACHIKQADASILFISSVYVLHQCRADRAGTCGELLEVSDYLGSKADLIEVYAEDRVVVKKGSDGLFYVLVLSELNICDNRLNGCCQRIGGDLESFAFIVDAHHVAEPAGLDQRDELKVSDIEVLSLVICLDGLAEADRKLLRGIGCDSLRRVGHERIGN